MAGKRDDRSHCFHIRLVVISNDRVGGYLGASTSLPKKCLRARPIPFVPQEHIDDLPVLVYCTIYVGFLLAAKAKHFVDGP
jgi:hypothetical protein